MFYGATAEKFGAIFRSGAAGTADVPRHAQREPSTFASTDHRHFLPSSGVIYIMRMQENISACNQSSEIRFAVRPLGEFRKLEFLAWEAFGVST